MRNEYTIVSIENKKLYGLSVALTKSQNRNYAIISNFWKEFNAKLRLSDLPKQTGGNWEKYGITCKTDEEYRYFCGIPVDNEYTNPNFEERTITQGNHILFKHKGTMFNLKDTFYSIYKDIIPTGKLVLNQSQYFHFERYSYQFKWNNENSIIEIYLPIGNSR
ncbi:MAG: GyrI-like domain-containing protein [Tannerellaceae bacterium]|jgi:AraC family transcriptional regulator|nr:GyrI-like domain-containing protein [Tannerellaceae bacterium]